MTMKQKPTGPRRSNGVFKSESSDIKWSVSITIAPQDQLLPRKRRTCSSLSDSRLIAGQGVAEMPRKNASSTVFRFLMRKSPQLHRLMDSWVTISLVALREVWIKRVNQGIRWNLNYELQGLRFMFDCLGIENWASLRGSCASSPQGTLTEICPGFLHKLSHRICTVWGLLPGECKPIATLSSQQLT